jgi:septation ring formation regulator EzrA
MEIDYKQKYLKYKLKYTQLKSQIGGDDKIDEYKENIIKNFDELFKSLGYETKDYEELSTNISNFTNFLTDITDDNKKIIIESLHKFKNIIKILTLKLTLLKKITTKISSDRCVDKGCTDAYKEKINKYTKLITNLKELIKTLKNIHKTYKKKSKK